MLQNKLRGALQILYNIFKKSFAWVFTSLVLTCLFTSLFQSFLILSFSQRLRPCHSFGLDFRMRWSCWTSSITSGSICSPSLPLRPNSSRKLIWMACWGHQRWRQMNREWLSPQVWLMSPTHVGCQRVKHWTAVVLFNCCFSDECIVPAEMKTQEWLLPETTASFNEIPLQYDGVCGYTLVNRDGLLLPGADFLF